MFDTTLETPVTYRSAAEVNSAMLRVYNHMALAVVTSMVVAMLVASSPALIAMLFGTWVKWLVIFAPLVFCFIVPSLLNGGMPKMAKIGVLHAFAGVMGLSMSVLMAVFTGGSIVTAFLGAAVLFGTMSFWGYFTKRSLESWGQFLFIGLIAIVIAGIANLLIASIWPGAIPNALISTVISALAIIVFTGLTAYDTQQIREQLMTDTSDSAELSGALRLYLDFINLFINLLQLFGIKKDE